MDVTDLYSFFFDRDSLRLCINSFADVKYDSWDITRQRLLFDLCFHIALMQKGEKDLKKVFHMCKAIIRRDQVFIGTTTSKKVYKANEKEKKY